MRDMFIDQGFLATELWLMFSSHPVEIKKMSKTKHNAMAGIQYNLLILSELMIISKNWGKL